MGSGITDQARAAERVPFEVPDARLADCMIATAAIRAEARLATSDPTGFAGLERMGLAPTVGG